MFLNFKRIIRDYVLSLIRQELKSDREIISKHESFIYYQNQHFIKGELFLGENSYIEESTRINIAIGSTLKFEGDNYVGRFGEISPIQCIQIGYGTSIQERSFILGDVKIGRFCIISNNVFICTGTHHYAIEPEKYIRDQNKIFQSSNNEHKDKIEIHDDVWIGHNVIVKPGVIIKKGAVINPFSTVDRNVDMYEIFSNNSNNTKYRLVYEIPYYILCSDTKYFPFLYSGFLLDQKHFTESTRFGGVYASKNFSLLLNIDGFVKIKLTIKKCVNSELKVTNKIDELIIKGSQFTELIFSINHKSKFQEFSIVDANDGYLPLIILKEVKLLP